VGDLSQLFPDSLIDLLPAMPMDRYPERGNAIKVFISVSVIKVNAVASVDDQLFVIHPVLHLSERVPEVFLVLV
jgi:hypothetical protein